MLNLLAVFVLVLPLSQAEAGSSQYCGFGPCNQTVIAEIHRYWNKYGIPQNPFSTIKRTDLYLDLHTSYTCLGDIFSCIYLEAAGCFLNFTAPFKDGGPARYNSYTVVQECGGVLQGNPTGSVDPQFVFKWYFLTAQPDVFAVYGCGSNGDVSQPAQWISS